jgi:2-methylisocitrate lyase-like PEP mutase family enzyme
MIAGVLGDIPLIADADTGYGAPLNVVRTVKLYDAAGVAAIQLEDQAFPKRCGHLAGKEIIDASSFEQTIGAALDSRSDTNLLVIARTDARGPLGLDEAIARANRYARAGADIIFVEAPQGVDEIERIAQEVDAPLLINLVLGGLTPLESAARLQELGYAVTIHPGNALAQATFGMLSAMCELTGRDPADLLPREPADFFNLVGLAEWAAIDQRYADNGTPSWA